MRLSSMTRLAFDAVVVSASIPSGGASHAMEKHDKATHPAEDDTVQCGKNADINFGDCSSVYETLISLGQDDGGWWTSKNGECSSWKSGGCKATFCPMVRVSTGLKIYMPELASTQFSALGVQCAAKGERGLIVPPNSTYALYISEPNWSE